MRAGGRRLSALRWAWVVTSGGWAVTWFQAITVNVRLMQPLGYGGPTWLVWGLGGSALALTVAHVAAGRRRATARTAAMWASTCWIWWTAAYVQWGLVVADVSVRDPRDHDTTPLEVLLLAAAVACTASAVRRRGVARRRVDD